MKPSDSQTTLSLERAIALLDAYGALSLSLIHI